MYEGVAVHVQGGKLFACEFGNTITEKVMTSRYEAALLAVQCVAYVEGVIASVAVGREV